MTNQHPVTPLPELVYRLRDKAPYGNLDGGTKRELHLIDAAYRAGADQELEACVEWLDRNSPVIGGFPLRIDRRPKPPSLKEQALHELNDVYNRDKIDDSTYDTIRRALEQL